MKHKFYKIVDEYSKIYSLYQSEQYIKGLTYRIRNLGRRVRANNGNVPKQGHMSSSLDSCTGEYSSVQRDPGDRSSRSIVQFDRDHTGTRHLLSGNVILDGLCCTDTDDDTIRRTNQTDILYAQISQVLLSESFRYI